ncbi:MAG: hypothetical protein Ct9H300mP13_2100 [Gammaproteobacteria bacterium]|nr:MAG: hypothetical protein Ct9H300mP13_2100 [Gammaproteobacteria bacterium]
MQRIIEELERKRTAAEEGGGRAVSRRSTGAVS